ncbi:MAG TPA: polysaccharide biosynthesis/export family protein [Gemmatimonadales bacterium]|jgi:polysaccharide export outer membrane protein
MSLAPLVAVCQLFLSVPVWAQTRDNAPPPPDLLRPGDVIKLNVWREPDWSGEFTVNENGIAVLPRLGGVHVTNMSADSLRRFLVDSLGRYLRNPSIEVIPLRTVQVLGAVQKPGLYPVPPSVTIGDVLALAGGASPDGQPDRAVLRRDGKDLTVAINSTTRLSDTPVRTGDQIYVPQRSWAARNPGLIAAGVSAFTTLFVAVILR